ncbi:MAG: hypothetical protein AAGF74_14835 [Pseudomonadota bacterium]
MLTTLVSDLTVFAHLVTVAFGMGIALQTELVMLRNRRKPLDDEILNKLSRRHDLVLFALVGLWATGLALVGLRTGFDVSTMSPKLWTKLAVVSLLTGNALLIGLIALPILNQGIGLRIGELEFTERVTIFTVAGISTTSWFVALALGSSALLKVAPAEFFFVALPIAYAGGILSALGLGLVLFSAPRRRVVLEDPLTRFARQTSAVPAE